MNDIQAAIVIERLERIIELLEAQTPATWQPVNVTHVCDYDWSLTAPVCRYCGKAPNNG